jgi:SAM-dependent methyltransferase
MGTPSQDLLRMGFGFAVAQALHVAAELGIADLLHDGPRSAEDLALATRTDAAALYRVLRFLASEGVFREDPAGRFAQTELSAGLRADAPDSPRDFIRMINREAYAAWGQLLHSVRTRGTAFEQVFGAPRFEWLASHPDQAALFQRAMIALSQGSNEQAAEAYDFAGCKRVVDVGGGHGQLLSAIVMRNPHLSGVLYDLSAGIAAARTGVGGSLPRCDLVAGDFFKSVPEGADIYIMKKVIHDWDDDRAAKILDNCRRAMAPGGKVLVAETIVPPGNDPHPIKLMDLNMLAVTGGMERTQEQYERLFERAGLRLARVIATKSPLSILESVAGKLHEDHRHRPA